LYNAALGVGALTASVGFGFLYERVGPPVAFVAGAVSAGVAAVLLLFVPAGNAKIVVSDGTNSRNQ
jgi:hypothetical protein